MPFTSLLALAVLTKGLLALVVIGITLVAYLAITGEWRRWREFHLFSGLLLFFVIAAPWHILAGLRNPAVGDHHGFFWFYFVNEHFLRFLGKRIPKDYNKLPGYLYWTLHLVWLFPWSLYLPLALRRLLRICAALAPRLRVAHIRLFPANVANTPGSISVPAPAGSPSSGPRSPCCSSPSPPIRSTTPFPPISRSSCCWLPLLLRNRRKAVNPGCWRPRRSVSGCAWFLPPSSSAGCGPRGTCPSCRISARFSPRPIWN